jgi:hypothetical protein
MCRKCDSFRGLSLHFCSLHKITMRLWNDLHRRTPAIIRAIASAKWKPRVRQTAQIFHIPPSSSNNWISVLRAKRQLFHPQIFQFSPNSINSRPVIISLELRFRTNHSGGKSCSASATLEPACAINFAPHRGWLSGGHRAHTSI